MRKICVVILLIFLISCARIPGKNLSVIFIDNGKNLIKINAEIADDNEERTRGLMFRKILDENSGMLFVFDDEDFQTFWMKNTLIPLDIIFIDNNFRIVDIKNAAPCEKDPCSLYQSSMPAKYVLEVNSRFSDKNNIRVQNMITINKNY